MWDAARRYLHLPAHGRLAAGLPLPLDVAENCYGRGAASATALSHLATGVALVTAGS